MRGAKVTRVAILFFGCWAFPVHADIPAKANANANANVNANASSPSAIAEAQFRLENLHNELELMVRNHRADESDVRRQERELTSAHAYERVPFSADIPKLVKELRGLGAAAGVQLLGVEVLRRRASDIRIPRDMYSDETTFRLKGDDVAETISIRVFTKGDADTVDRWAAGWKSAKRLIDFPEGQSSFRSFPDGRGHRTIDARVYRFRNISFPRIHPRDPLAFLPVDAQRDPSSFARTQPRLWGHVEKIRQLTPTAQDFYALRGRFFVNDARLAFLISKLGLNPAGG